MSRWLLSIISVLVSSTLSVAINIGTTPDELKKYVLPAWVVTVFLVIISIILEVRKSQGEEPPLPPIYEGRFHILKETVDEAVSTINLEQDTAITQGREHLYANWESRLSNWKEAARELLIIAGYVPNGRKAWEIQIRHQEAARAISQLIDALGPAMLQRGKQQEFLSIAPPAYGIAKALKSQGEAITLAYHIAHAYYDQRDIANARVWFELLENTYPQNDRGFLQHPELRLMYLEMKGLLAKYDNHKNEAKSCFTEALSIANKLQRERNLSTPKKWLVNRMIGVIHMRLGELAEDERDRERAKEEYLNAINNSSDHNVQLKCYDNLAKLADIRDEYDEEQHYYEMILILKQKVGNIAISTAHEGLARVSINKPLDRQQYTSDQDYQTAFKKKYLDAYKHLLKALEAEKDNPNGKNANRIRETLVNDVIGNIIDNVE